MSDDSTSNQSNSPTSARRSSFAGQALADLFGTNRHANSRNLINDNPSPPNSATAHRSGSISQAAAQAQRRRMSLTTLGLSGSPNQTSPFGSYRGRGDSLGSANSNSAVDDSAIAEDDGPSSSVSPTSPSHFARRTSFGARALRDRMSSMGGTGGGTGGLRSPTDHNNGSSEGFNWSDNFLTRAERNASVAAGASMSVSAAAAAARPRNKSVATMEPPPASTLPPPKEQKRPDHFQERILKGDFYMD